MMMLRNVGGRSLILFFLVFSIYFVSTKSVYPDTIIKVGVYNNEPLIFYGDHGKGKGIFADIIEWIAEKEGWTISYVPGTFQDCLDRLTRDEIDILCTIAVSKEREKQYRFSRENILTNWGQLYAAKHSGVQDITDIAGKTVAVLKKDIHYKSFKETLSKFGISCNFTEANTYPEVLDLVSDGKADAGIANRFFGLKYTRYNLEKTGVIFNPIRIHFAFPKNQRESFIQTIDQHVLDLKASKNSVYHRSIEKWFGMPAYEMKFPGWIKFLLLGILMLLIFLCAGNLFLRTQVKRKTLELSSELNERENAENKLRTTLNSIGDAVISTDKTGRITLMNTVAEKLTGWCFNDARNQSAEKVIIIRSLSSEKVLNPIKEILQSGKTMKSDKFATLISRDHNKYQIMGTASPIKDNRQNLSGVVIVLCDVTKEYQLRQAIKQTEIRFQSIINNSETAIYQKDLEGRYIIVNRQFEKLFNIDRSEVNGLKDKDIFPAETAVELQKNDRQVLQMAKPVLFEERISYKGTQRYYVSVKFPLVDSGGEIYSVCGISTDITDRKRTEKALAESEEKFRLTFQTSPDSINLNRVSDGMYVEINEGFTKIMEYGRADIIGKTSLELNIWNNPEDRQLLIKGLQKRGFVENLEAEFVTKTGKIRNGLMSARIIQFQDETLILSITRDITDRVLAQKTLKKSEQKYRTLFEKTNDAIFIVEKKSGKYIGANRAAEILTGRSCRELMNLSVHDVSPTGAEQRLEKINQSTGTIELGKTVYIRPNGEKRVAVLSSVPLDTDTVIGIAHDITKELVMENHVRRAQKMEAIGTLAGGIAHDFNNILSGIFGYSQLAQNHIDEPERIKSDLKNIVKIASRATELIQQILTVSREANYKKQHLNIDVILKEVLKLIRATIPATIEIKSYINSNAPILADPTQMHQMLMNLCTNAYHAMNDTSGTLTVRLEKISSVDKGHINTKKQEYLKLEVCDTGHGMAKDTMGKIFDPYFTTKPREKGTGLGLSIVHSIVLEHKGEIKVDSIVGKGTTFTIHLPVVEKKDKSHHKNASRKKIPVGKESILFVEDEESIRSVVKDILGKKGYQITLAENGLIAYENFKKDPDNFDMVITDMAMPKMNGLELSKKILNLRKKIPIIFCTGFIGDKEADQINERGISFIQKPVAMTELGFLIRKILDHKNN